MKTKSILTTAFAATILSFGANAFADNAATIFGQTGGTAVTYDSNPVITAILSQPGSLDGYTYSTWSILAADSTGSLDIYGVLPDTIGFTPAVGDAISFSGTYSPYHQIPEIATNATTSISLISTGNSVPSPAVFTIPDLIASGTGTIPANIAGHLLELDNVSLYTDSAATIPVSGNFATHANTALYAKDSGGNIMEIYAWASSYSTVGALGGTAIPTGTVNIVGFVSQSGSFNPEMTPYSITAVPEPTTLSLVGGAALLGLALRRRKM